MARKFLTAIDLGTNELQNAVIQNLAAVSEPTGVKGRIYFDSTNNLIKFYDGTAWKAIATGGDLGSYQPLDADLTAISAISGTGIAVRTASDTWSTITDNSSNWNTAYGWGDHSLEGYLTSADLSNYVTLDGTQTITGEKTFKGPIKFIGATDSTFSGQITPSYEGGGLSIESVYGPLYLKGSYATGEFDNYVIIGNAQSGSKVFIDSSGDPNNEVAILGDLANFITASSTDTLTNKTISDSLTFQNTGSTNTIYADGNDLTIYGHNNIYLTTNNADINLQPDGNAKVWGSVIATQDWVGGQGYLTSYTETDPIYTASSWYTTTNNANNWDTAYGWGNHASAGYLTVAATSVTGTANEITVSGTGSDPYTGAITIGLPDDVTIGGSLTVTGDLTVNGTVTTLNTSTVAIEDNIFLLNSNVTGTPVSNAGIEVERGTDTNASILWDETNDIWTAGLVGDESKILTSSNASASDISDFDITVDSEIDAYVTGSNSISVSSGAIDTTLATTSYLSKSSGLAVDVSSLETKLITDNFVKKYAAQNSAITISGGVATWTVTHNLGSRDVNVQVYEVSGYGAVEVDVVRTSTSVVTLSWNAAANVDADTYRVVVTG